MGYMIGGQRNFINKISLTPILKFGVYKPYRVATLSGYSE